MGMEGRQVCLSSPPKTLTLPEPRATVPSGATKSPNEERPLGSSRQGECCQSLPAPLPLGPCLVEPRGFPTL